MLHLTTFGGLSVDIDGIPGSGAAQQRKTLGLLALLAASRNRGLSRDKVIASLWPDTDAEHGRRLLKQACYALRRDLHAPDLFLGSIQLRLNPAVISSDVESFTFALDEHDPGRAVSFYTAPFLDGFYLNGGGEFETWAETERARMAAQYRAALEVLSAGATERGEHRVAADWWRRLLELDPLSSRAALGLMTALDNAGDHAEALRRGQAYGELLRRELGDNPPAELSRWIHHRPATGNGVLGNGVAENRAKLSNQIRASHPASVDRLAPAEGLADILGVAPVIVPARRASKEVRRWGAVIGVAVLIAAASVLLSHQRGDLPTDPNLLAIVPFDVLDPSLQIWHEGLVDVLSRDLDGAGPLRTVPQTISLKLWEGRADRLSAERFGRRTGAGLVVFGSISKAKDTVSLRATVKDLSHSRAETDLEVKGEVSSVGGLADSLGVRILQVLGQNRPIGAVRRVSIASRSLPALKAFLYGEQFYRRGLWDSALVYYDQAIAQDSTFALAFRRMNLVLSWFPASSNAYHPMEEYLRKSIRLNHGVSPKDSLLIAVDSLLLAADDAIDPAELIRFKYRALSTLEVAARRYPGDPEVWLDLGEARFHQAPPLGGVPGPALEAFDHAIALDSGFAAAYEHTVRLAIQLNRPDLARKYADAYLRLDPIDVHAPSIRLASLMLDPARSHAPETGRVIDNASAQVLFGAGMMHLGWWADSGEAAVRLLRTLTTRSGTGVDPWSDTLMYRQYLAFELAYRGHLREAYAVDRRLLLDPNASRFSEFLDPFLGLSLLGVIPESLAATTYGHAIEAGKAWPASPLGTARQLRGLPWWLARKDTASMARFVLRAGHEAQSQRSAHGKLQSRYLQVAATAYFALARADSVRALRLFQTIPDTLCLENNCYYEKLTEARLLNVRGRAREAGAVLDHWVWSGWGSLFVLGIMERARIAEGLSERQKAMDSYQFVVDVWRRADPQLQPFVMEARNALTRLKRE
jgi:DNA-binding SARP family transcriptional activator